jgi:hypothetical protein
MSIPTCVATSGQLSTLYLHPYRSQDALPKVGATQPSNVYCGLLVTYTLRGPGRDDLLCRTSASSRKYIMALACYNGHSLLHYCLFSLLFSKPSNPITLLHHSLFETPTHFFKVPLLISSLYLTQSEPAPTTVTFVKGRHPVVHLSPGSFSCHASSKLRYTDRKAALYVHL